MSRRGWKQDRGCVNYEKLLQQTIVLGDAKNDEVCSCLRYPCTREQQVNRQPHLMTLVTHLSCQVVILTSNASYLCASTALRGYRGSGASKISLAEPLASS
jgi:hypothetical protein